jgi:hypothetical protein
MAERVTDVGSPPGYRCVPDCTSVVIKWPGPGSSPGVNQNDGGRTGTAVSFELFPENCSITDAMKSALPTGTSHTTTTTGIFPHNFNPNKPTQRYSKIEIPCHPNAPEGLTETRTIAWDLSALATALGDSNVGAYKASVTHSKVTNKGCAGDDGYSGIDPLPYPLP